MSTSRRCGECQLCCKLLPVKEFGKPANARCKHQRHSAGCTIYAARPGSCRTWSCAWRLSGEGTENLSRPDRAHYVIDMMPDYLTLVEDATGDRQTIPCLQIWLDAGYPHAHRDPQLRAYLAHMAQAHGMAALVRSPNDTASVAIFAPAMSADQQWHEMTSREHRQKQHDVADIARVMAQHGLSLKIELEPEGDRNG